MPAEFEPTTDQRALVQNAAAFGINQADIANQLNIDEKTLRKHFREELNSGKFKVDMLAGRTVTELMKSGEERVRLDAANHIQENGVKPWAYVLVPHDVVLPSATLKGLLARHVLTGE